MKTKKELINYLLDNNLTISSCESFTGGFFANWLTDTPGVSKVYKGGFVSYSNDFKHEIIKVDDQIIKKYGVISRECALAMAKNTLELTKSDIAISFTGNAGPTASDHKEVGLAFICIYSNSRHIILEINEPELLRIQFKKNALKVCLENFNAII